MIRIKLKFDQMGLKWDWNGIGMGLDQDGNGIGMGFERVRIGFE